MRIVLADIRGGDGFLSKDTVAGGYGSRLRPFSKVTRVVAAVKRRFHDVPSVHLAYVAALASRAGHEVVGSKGEPVDGDMAIVLSSLVDHRAETAWADRMRARGVRVGFIGLAAQRLPQLFDDHADFIVDGEPEAAVMRLAAGERLQGRVPSPQVDDLDSLPFPLWDPLVAERRGWRVPFAGRPAGESEVALRVVSRPSAVDPGTATIPVRLGFVRPTNLPAGAPVQVDIDAEKHDGVVVVPDAAVVREAEETAIFIVTDSKAARHEIKIGLSDGMRTEILSGVSAGDQVIVEGQAGLPDGAAVTTPKPESDASARDDK